MDDANYATADISSQTSFQEGIRPVADAFIEALDQKAVSYYHQGFSIALADRNPHKELDEANRSRILYDGEIMYQNEAREANGLSPVPGGNRFKNGVSAVESVENKVENFTLQGLRNNTLLKKQNKNVTLTTKNTPQKKGKKAPSNKSKINADIESIQLQLFD